MAKFIKLESNRYQTSTIKRYNPTGTKGLNIHFSTSRTNLQYDSIKYKTTKERDEALELLDAEFLNK